MKRYLTLLAMAAVAFMACDPEQHTPEPQPEPKPEVKPVVFELTSDAAISFGAEGGNGTITYTLENPVEGVEVTATCEAEWVSDLTAGENVTFTVPANESTENRNATITVSYGEISHEVAVSQEGRIPDPVFTLTSEATLSFTAEGGAGEITYTLENPVEGVEVTATCEASWVSVTAGEKISFTVAANEATETRTATIKVAYGELGFDVTVNQEAFVPSPAYDVEVVATYMDVYYYGGGNYYITLSDNGFQDDGYFKPSSYYFYVDAYAYTYQDGTVTPDTYEFDIYDTYEPRTFSIGYSYLQKTDAAGSTGIGQTSFEAGTFVVTENMMDLVVTDINGVTYHVVYNGPNTY